MIRLSAKKRPESARMLVLKQNSIAETFQLHCHDFHEFFLVTKGRALHLVNGSYQIVSRGSLVFVRPDDAHCYDYYKSQDFTFYNSGLPQSDYERLCQFYGEEAVKALDTLPLSKHVILTDAQTHRLEEPMEQLLTMKDEKSRIMLYRRLSAEAMYYFLTADNRDSETRPPDWLLHVLDEMAKPENFVQGLDRLIQIANYSQEYINREFRRHLGTTPTHYINELRLRYAHELLSQTDLPIVEICETCGFHNLSHFYTCFSEYFDTSPAKLRRTLTAAKREETNAD